MGTRLDTSYIGIWPPHTDASGIHFVGRRRGGRVKLRLLLRKQPSTRSSVIGSPRWMVKGLRSDCRLRISFSPLALTGGKTSSRLGATTDGIVGPGRRQNAGDKFRHLGVRISSTFGIQNKIEPELYSVMSRRISISEPDGAAKEPSQFAYNGHHIEIVPPDEEHLKGNLWQTSTAPSSRMCCIARHR